MESELEVIKYNVRIIDNYTRHSTDSILFEGVKSMALSHSYIRLYTYVWAICSYTGELFKVVVLNPGPGEPQGVLASIVAQQLIDQWKQLITQLRNSPHLVLGSELFADFRVKKKGWGPLL